jgi:hypothetical protein
MSTHPEQTVAADPPDDLYDKFATRRKVPIIRAAMHVAWPAMLAAPACR